MLRCEFPDHASGPALGLYKIFIMTRNRRKQYLNQLDPVDDAKNHCRQRQDKCGFQKKFINQYIGHGVFTTTNFKKGDFLLEYAGELISAGEGNKRDEHYPEASGSFLFFFGKDKCVDATNTPQRLGRFVNDSPAKETNCYMKVIDVDGKPHLCLFARCDIRSAAELRYDYGVPGLPWRQKSNEHRSSSNYVLDSRMLKENTAEEDKEASTMDMVTEENEITAKQTAAEKGQVVELKNGTVEESCKVAAIAEKCDSTAKENAVEVELGKDVNVSAVACTKSTFEIIGKESEISAKETISEQSKEDPGVEEACEMSPQEITEEESEIPVNKNAVGEIDVLKKDTNLEGACKKKAGEILGEEEEEVTAKETVVEEHEKSKNDSGIEKAKACEISAMEITGEEIWEGEITTKETVVEEHEKSKNDSGIEKACEIPAMEIIGEEIWEGEATAKETAVEDHEKSKNDSGIEKACEIPAMEIIGEEIWEGEATAKQTAVEEHEKSKNDSGIEKACEISAMEIIGEEIWEGEATAKETAVEECEKSKNDSNEEQVGKVQATEIFGKESEITCTARETDDCVKESDVLKKHTDVEEPMGISAMEVIAVESAIATKEAAAAERKISTKRTVVDEACEILNKDSSEESRDISTPESLEAVGEGSDTTKVTTLKSGTRKEDTEVGKRGVRSSSRCGLPNFKESMLQVRRNRQYPVSSPEEYISDSGDSGSDVNDPTYIYQYKGSHHEESDSDSDSDSSVQTSVVNSTVGVVKDAEMLEGEHDEVSPEPPNPSLSKKPRRRCPFCDVFQASLSRHIKLRHKDIKRVADAINAPEKERLKLFDGFKKEGILKENQEQAMEENPQYHQEKKSKTRSKKLIMCGNCQGFYNQKFFARHRTICLSEACDTTVSVPLSLLTKLDEAKGADEYLQEVLCKLREDEIGQICKKDPVIVLVGKRLYMKSKLKADKKNEVRKSVMSSMRRLAVLYNAFNDAEEELGPINRREATVADMFRRCNFSHLEQAVVSCTLKGNTDGTEDLKHGLKSALYYLIKRTCKILKGTYLIDDNDEKADEIDKFTEVFELNQNYLFGDASYAMAKKRNETLRKPAELPLETDVKKVRDYTVSRLQEIVNDTFELFDSHSYVELRDLLVCRLTLFNARRGGEPCRLRLCEWKDAEQGVWIDSDEVEKLDNELDKALAKDMKIAYQTGKGNRHLVPVLLPADTVDPLKKITKEENRHTAGISKNNPYVFASSQNSMYHVSGWHAVHNVCEKLDLEKGNLLTATKNRHRVSTMYAVMDIPESDRRYFYEHMGHSKEINHDIYQAPLALMEVLKVGRSLKEIDDAKQDDDMGDINMDVLLEHDQDAKQDDDMGDINMDILLEHDQGEDSDQEQSEMVVSSSSRSQKHKQGGDKGNMGFASSTRDKSCRKGRKYTRWTQKEETEVKTYFNSFILGKRLKKLPGRKEILEFLEKANVKHDWWTIRTKVMNEKVKREKLVQQRMQEMEVSQ